MNMFFNQFHTPSRSSLYKQKNTGRPDASIRTPVKFVMGLLTFLFFLGSCDKIEPPYTTENLNQPPDQEQVERNILLEEFTGHQCPNCPEGTNTSKTLSDFYGDRLVIVSIHAGFFANPMGSTFQYDFRTNAGDELNAYFGVELNPVGMVNRRPFDGSLLLGHTAWGSAITEFTDNDPYFQINVSGTASNNNEDFDLEVTVKALKNLEETHHLVVLITEDKIIKPQKTNDPNIENGVIMDFEHNHVLRKTITNIWGDPLKESPLEVNEQITRSYTMELEQEWNAENCHIVAYVFNSETLEVMQAFQTTLI